MSSLSVMCATRDPGPRVRALLERLRPVADEIVVAVDRRAGEEHLAEYSTVADRVLRFEVGASHSSLAFLHDQCRGDWILTVAGDEVASAELVAVLPELIRRRDALQVWVPLRWLHPDTGRWLAAPPWYPDFHPRLVRNDGTLRFAGRKHELARPVLPARWIEAPLWHLDLLLSDLEQRRAKVARNEAIRPGLTVAGGRPLNEAYYLPEEAAAAPTEPVPEEDRVAIEAVLAATSVATGAPPAVPLAEGAEVERRWAGRAVGGGAYRARVEPLEPALELRPGEHRTVFFRVRNDGEEEWPWGLDLEPLIRVGHRWEGGGEGPRAPFPHDVPPGMTCVVPVPVVAPSSPGRHTLEVDVVHEGVRWFGAVARVPVRVG